MTVPMLSPCAHTPTCPQPGPCLPQTLRTSTVSLPLDVPSPPPPPGYEVHAGYIRSFAGVMDESAVNVEVLRNGVPRFEGWNLAPLAGVPLVGLLFVQRLNTIADEWANCAGILKDVHASDSAKLNAAAGNYVAAERASAMKHVP